MQCSVREAHRRHNAATKYIETRAHKKPRCTKAWFHRRSAVKKVWWDEQAGCCRLISFRHEHERDRQRRTVVSSTDSPNKHNATTTIESKLSQSNQVLQVVDSQDQRCSIHIKIISRYAGLVQPGASSGACGRAWAGVALDKAHMMHALHNARYRPLNTFSLTSLHLIRSVPAITHSFS